MKAVLEMALWRDDDPLDQAGIRERLRPGFFVVADAIGRKIEEGAVVLNDGTTVEFRLRYVAEPPSPTIIDASRQQET